MPNRIINRLLARCNLTRKIFAERASAMNCWWQKCLSQRASRVGLIQPPPLATVVNLGFHKTRSEIRHSVEWASRIKCEPPIPQPATAGGDNKNNTDASAVAILHHEICRVYIKYTPDSDRFTRNREHYFRDALAGYVKPPIEKIQSCQKCNKGPLWF